MKMIYWLTFLPTVFLILLYIDYKIYPYKKKNIKYKKLEIYIWSTILTIYFFIGILLYG